MACTHVTNNGRPCGAQAIRGKRTCVFHTRGKVAERLSRGRRKGGLNRKAAPTTLPEDTPPVRLETAPDVRNALAEVFNLVRVGKLGVNVGNALGQLGSVLLRSMEKSDLEQRIQALETRRRASR